MNWNSSTNAITKQLIKFRIKGTDYLKREDYIKETDYIRHTMHNFSSYALSDKNYKALSYGLDHHLTNTNKL